jgi:hypothetical protein
VKKKDGSLCLVVDYRGLNKVIIRNRYALPLNPSLLERIGGSEHFTKIDLSGGAYIILSVFYPGMSGRVHFALGMGFRVYIMSFRLTNDLAIFQHMTNDIFRDFLNIFLIIYLDDLLIYMPKLVYFQTSVIRLFH